MTLIRRVLLLALISVSGIALLAPLAARSAATLAILPVDTLLPRVAAPASDVDRGTLSARAGVLVRSVTAGSETLTAAPIRGPGTVAMQATIVSIAPPKPAAAPARVVRYDGDTVWDDLAQCESSGNWAANTGNGYYGGLQFSHDTWHGYGGGAFANYPHQATRDQQIVVAERLRAARGYAPWPACRVKLGLP